MFPVRILAPMAALLALVLFGTDAGADASYDSFIVIDGTICYEPKPKGEGVVELEQWEDTLLTYGQRVTVHPLEKAPWDIDEWTLVGIGNGETCLVKPSMLFPFVKELPKVGVNPDVSDDPLWGIPAILALGGFIALGGLTVMACIAGYLEHRNDEIPPRALSLMRRAARMPGKAAHAGWKVVRSWAQPSPHRIRKS